MFRFRQDSTDSMKKPLKRDYMDENAGGNAGGNAGLLPRDKFQLPPQRLKLKGILGSGAYGIVRLASLRDEFGAVTDVAVKMMKGIARVLLIGRASVDPMRTTRARYLLHDACTMRLTCADYA